MRLHAHTRDRSATAALVLAAIALFIALGGPAYAARTINGSTIKAKSITATQLADGSVSLTKIAKSAQKSLKAVVGPAGALGTQGAPGPQGSPGPQGHVGGYDVFDAKGRRVGTYEGLFSLYTMVANDQGAIFLYDSAPGTYPLPVVPGALFYKTAGCDSPPYGNVGSFPANFGFTMNVPAGGGETAYILGAGTPESFTAQSMMTAVGCQDSSGAVNNMVPALEAGTVQTVSKPLFLRPKT